MGRPQRLDGTEQSRLRVAARVRGIRGWGLHCEQGGDLEEVVLDDVPDRPGFLIEPPSTLDAEVLGHRDLHALDVHPVPDRLEEGVRKPEVEEVHDRLLPEEVVDTEDRFLGERRVKGRVQLLRRCEVAPERLLDDHASIRRAARRREAFDNGREERRRDGEVVERTGGAFEAREQLLERGWILVVAVDVAQQRRELREGLFIDRPVAHDALASPFLQLVEIPTGLGDADDGDVEPAVLHERKKRREDALVRKVSRGPEEHERVGALGRHVGLSGWSVRSSRSSSVTPDASIDVISLMGLSLRM